MTGLKGLQCGPPGQGISGSSVLRVNRHVRHVVGRSAAEYLCSQRLPVRISALQLLRYSQLTQNWDYWD